MQQLKNKNYIYSPLDLVTFLSCRYATTLDIRKITENLTPTKKENSSKLFAQKGLEHEISYLDQLKKEGKQVVEIPKHLDLNERIRLTNNFIHSGPDIIYQAVLYHNE